MNITLHRTIQDFSKEQNITEKNARFLHRIENSITLLLMFMLAFLVVFAQSVDIAAGGVFLLAIFFLLLKKNRTLRTYLVPKYGYIFLVCLIGYFLVSVVSFLIAEAAARQLNKLDLPLRYLLLIPCFFLFCNMRLCFKPLLIAASVGAMLSSVIAIYQHSWLGIHDPVGAVSHRILFGCFSVVLTLFSLASFFVNRELIYRVLGGIGFFSGLVAIFLSGSRCAWIGFFVCVVMLLCLWMKKHPKRLLMVGSMFLFLMLFLFNHNIFEKFSSRFLDAKTEISLYSHEGLTGNYSVGLRLEMWKAALMIFAKNPIVGSGPRSFELNASQLIDSGSINAYAKGYKHAHNDYLTVLASRGMLGFIFFLGITVFPAFVFIKSYRQCFAEEDVPALLGMIISVTYIVFGLSETMFDRMMSVMFYLLLVSFCLSQCYLFKKSRKIKCVNKDSDNFLTLSEPLAFLKPK